MILILPLSPLSGPAENAFAFLKLTAERIYAGSLKKLKAQAALIIWR
jgi:hypothetical protein